VLADIRELVVGPAEATTCALPRCEGLGVLLEALCRVSGRIAVATSFPTPPSSSPRAEGLFGVVSPVCGWPGHASMSIARDTSIPTNRGHGLRDRQPPGRADSRHLQPDHRRPLRQTRQTPSATTGRSDLRSLRSRRSPRD